MATYPTPLNMAHQDRDRYRAAEVLGAESHYAAQQPVALHNPGAADLLQACQAQTSQPRNALSSLRQRRLRFSCSQSVCCKGELVTSATLGLLAASKRYYTLSPPLHTLCTHTAQATHAHMAVTASSNESWN
jgi:hypothetical protein